LTLDVRNTAEDILSRAEREISEFMAVLSLSEGVDITSRSLARFEPVIFHPQVIDIVERVSTSKTPSVRRMPSGAGHDAQMLARVCPTSMIFVPSVGGISHNPAEHTEPEDLIAGANVLLATLTELAN
jgi:N-carbamoyl-L-amino-acid hydrolase